MCLGQIGQVVGLDGAGRATVRSGAQELTVALLTLDEPAAVGDWLVVHSGFALQRLSAEEAEDALAIRAAGSPSQPGPRPQPGPPSPPTDL
ncbi:MAG TPA: HypC/HybG/HupF family hydrogenase formation chaperone [Intrasporangium sp.]|nr:HypC/HybG/HupF family hydrogenase formation chaperone [Intrasporangium sp.]